MYPKDEFKALSISKVISEFVPLRAKGEIQEGHCPFHTDQKFSLKVNDKKGFFKCFICGAGGDAIRFIMDHKRISFKEAITYIGHTQGIKLPGLFSIF